MTNYTPLALSVRIQADDMPALRTAVETFLAPGIAPASHITVLYDRHECIAGIHIHAQPVEHFHIR